MQRAILPIMLLTGLTACAAPALNEAASMTPAPGAIVQLNGTASYRERIALPRDARLLVRISDVSRMDAPATLIAETDIASEGRQVPLSFSITYDPTHIIPGRRYAVSARVTDGTGRLIWTTDTHVDLPLPGQMVDLRLVQVPN